MSISKSAIIWKINRLFSMNYREMIYRFVSTIKVNRFFEKNIPELLLDKQNYCLEYFIKTDQFGLKNSDVNILSNSSSFNLYGKEISINDIRWNYDVIDNKSYPTGHISKIKLLDFADKEVKNIFEIHRHSFLVDLAIEYKRTNDKNILDTITDCLKSWLKDNPVGYGMGWLLPTISAKRLISWLMIWQIADFNKHEQLINLRYKLIKSIEAHIWTISESLSLYSSANNHLTAESVSLFVILKSCGSLLSKKGIKLFDRTSKQLNELISDQNFSDGKNKECSFGYQYQVLDWFFLAYISDIKIGKRRLDARFETYLKNMFKYFNRCFDNYFNFFDYGDRDNFSVFPFPYQSSKDAFFQLLKSGAILFKDQNLVAFNYKKEKLDIRNTLLFGSQSDEIKNGIGEKREFCEKYLKSGHIVVNYLDSHNNEIYFNFRAGDFGYLSIAAHSHSDLNSFFLSINGQPIFIDPGTYCYRKDPEFRNYFRSSIAHNTVSINKQNHAVSYGYNHWKNKKNIFAEIVNYKDSTDKISFSSRSKFPDGAVHIRNIIIEKKYFKLSIIDEIEYTNKVFNADIALHLAPDLSYLLKKNRISLNNGLSLELDTKLSFEKMKGSNSPELLGWFSPEFSELIPTESLLSRVKGKSKGKFEIIFKIEKIK